MILWGCQSIEDVAAGIKDLPFTELRHGVHLGESLVFPVKVRVKVNILEKRVKSIEILEHFNGQGQKAEAILENIIASQTLGVDGISGATYSSTAIKQAF